MKTENEKLGQEPIVPTVFRKVGDNEFMVASERDVNDHHATLIRTEGMSKRFYAACQILSGMTANIEFCKLNAKTAIAQRRNPDEFLVYTAYSLADELLSQENL